MNEQNDALRWAINIWIKNKWEVGCSKECGCRFTIEYIGDY